tara:strand:+ start:575 stop:1231 length:657 start_codon:yes stop_codon:yes gene_type:complete
MGKALEQAVILDKELELAGIWRRGGDINELLSRADILIDFSLPDANEVILNAVIKNNTPLVCGVSGFDDQQFDRLVNASNIIPIIFDRNMSLGIAVLERSVREAAASIGLDFEIEISEIHHANKKDAPSGTALKLGEAISTSLGDKLTKEIKYFSERYGEVIGDHEVKMESSTEKLTFSHSTTTRQVFVDGAIQASKWILNKSAGFYSMQDVLFSKTK